MNGQILLTVEKKYDITEKKLTTIDSMQNAEYTNPIQLTLSVALSSSNFVIFPVILSLVVFCKKRLPTNDLIKILKM